MVCRIRKSVIVNVIWTLIANDKSRQTFVVRSKILAAIRQFMVARGFMEVETPMMQVIPVGHLLARLLPIIMLWI